MRLPLLSCSTSILLALPASAPAQAPLLVPQQFPDIGAAVQAATPGAVIVVSAQVQPQPPFVIDRPVTIVGQGIEHDAPTVVAASGIGIEVRLAPGERVVLSRIDVVGARGTALVRGIVQRGGLLTLEDCRISCSDDPSFSSLPCAVEVTNGELALHFSRLLSGRGVPALRAQSARVAASATRFFGGGAGVDSVTLQDSDGHFSDCWILGGEDFFGTPGGAAMRTQGNARAWLVGCDLRGGVGTPGASGLINATANAVELSRTSIVGGAHLSASGAAPAVSGATFANGDLLALRWNEPPYRRGSLQLGQVFALHLESRAFTPVLLLTSLAPHATNDLFTREPALALTEVAALFSLVTNAGGLASLYGAVPRDPAFVGATLWAQGAGVGALGIEVSPLAGATVRP
ncbi:MAG: hypothetical protein JNM84_07895 [Planctomycetes bacterium]|nr:hypothetical protein [Planctomycetota bacterium]